MAKLLQPQEAADLLRQGTHSYLDVRTPEEFAAGHVEGAVNIPLMLATATGGKEPNPDFLQQVKQQFPNTDQALVVGCKAGGRSATACKMLTAESYTNLLDQTAGFDGWLAAKLPVKQ